MGFDDENTLHWTIVGAISDCKDILSGVNPNSSAIISIKNRLESLLSEFEPDNTDSYYYRIKER